MRLSAAVRLRTSCRAYAGPLSAGDLATLAYHTGRFALPGARLTLIPSPGDAFVDLTGSPAAVGVIICGDSWQNRLHAGFIGEAFVLEATSMGLGTCWVGGSYRRQAVTGHTAPGETLLCLIAVAALVGLVGYFLTKHVPLSFIIGGTLAAILLIVFLIDSSLFAGLFPALLSTLALFDHFGIFSYGLLDIPALILYLSVSVFFVTLTILGAEKKRWA